MKQSIRYRFTLIFIGLTAMFLLIIWCANNLWLEEFYMADKLRVLEDAYVQIDQLFIQAEEEGRNVIDEFDNSPDVTPENGSLAQILQTMGDKSNVSAGMIDSITGKAIVPFSSGRTILTNKVKGYILGFDMPPSEVLRENNNYMIQRTYDEHSKVYYLESWGYFSDNRTVFIMSVPLASIQESVSISNRFLGYVGIAVMLFGSIIMYFTTRRITAPILKLASLSEKMTNLDFEAKYTGDAADEIGVLGNSMNILSAKLKATVGALKSANNELQQDIEQKIKIDETRKDFIANVSHELKTPIALIQGYAEGLTEGMCEDEESRSYYCEVIMDEANKMNIMVKQLLALSALEFGNDAPVFERFDLTDLISGVIASAGIMIQQKKVTVSFDSSEPVYVWADEFKIEEVITNYLNNALNHVKGDNLIRIRAEAMGSVVRISVYNTGDPIPEEDLPNLWTKFYKVDKARTRAYGGSGIGLSIVKAIMDSHHKDCGVANVEGGVAFWFTLDQQNME